MGQGEGFMAEVIETRLRSIAKLSNESLFGLESSLYKNFLSNVIANRPVILSNSGITLLNQNFVILPNKTGDEDIEECSNGLRFTTPERTICDMINYDRREDLIIEALDDYLSEPEKFKGKEYLLEIARKYKVEYKVLGYIDEIDDYFNY